jgi:hypothetical protein
MSDLPRLRTAFVHIGTHKTGTTSIQAMLAMNEKLFRSAGVFVPRCGRNNVAYAGHHNIAWDLARDGQFDPSLGSFDALLADIAASDASTVCLSSEEFEFLHADEAAMERLRDGLSSIGYETRIIVYVRPQADYIESLYAEIARAWNIGFDDFLETIVAEGSYCLSRFDYVGLIDAFARTFSTKRVIVRAYKIAESPSSLLHDFVRIVAADVRCDKLQLPPRLNCKSAFADVIEARKRLLDCVVPYQGLQGQAFDPLSLFDLMRIALRFSGSNGYIARTYGAHIPCASPSLIAREILTEVLRDRESRFRKRLIRVLVDDAAEFAA